jgi:xanthine dehydrogenase accessory factor
MFDWLQTMLALCERREACVLVTVAEVRGSTPREAGTKMVATKETSFGTIGGGRLEYEVLAAAREMLAARAPPSARLRRFGLGPSLGQCCGGSARVLLEPTSGQQEPWQAALREVVVEQGTPAVLVSALNGSRVEKLVVSGAGVVGALADPRRHGAAVGVAQALLEGADAGARLEESDGAVLLFEPVRPDAWQVVLFGAGHVGKALIGVLGELSCRVAWVDGRAEQFPDEVPANVVIDCTESPQYAVDRAPSGAAFLVMTHSHAIDLKLCEKILHRNDFSYFGLIGSATKRAKFIRRFKARGIADAVIDRMVCPIGIPELSGKHPGEIAVAVAAQLLMVRAGDTHAVGPPPAVMTAAQGAGSR